MPLLSPLARRPPRGDLDLLREVLGRPHADAARTEAGKAVGIWVGLPPAHRDGLVRSRVEALHRVLPGAARTRLGEALAS